MSLRVYARTHRFAFWLTLIATAGFLFRVAYAVVFRHQAVISDGFRYHLGALLLADGKGFANPFNLGVPDTGHPPAWTVLLAVPTKLGLRTWLEHQLLASVVGTATIVMVGVAARTALGIRTALFAAALTAFYPNIFLYERALLSETLAMLGIATTIWLAYKFLAAPGPGLAIALGALVGVLAMTKSDQVAIAVVLVAPLILSRRDVYLRRRIGWLAMAAAVCVAVMSPWSIYLSTRFDRPVLLTGSIGGAMSAGNCAQTYSGELLAWYDFRCVIAAGTPGVDPLTRDEQERRHAIHFMLHNKRRVPVVMAARVGRTFGFFRPFQQLHLEFAGATRSVARWGLFEYWVLLPLAVAGAVIARRRQIPIYPLLVFPAVAVFSVLLTIGAVRYRAPGEIPLVILSAVALDAVVSAWRRRDARAKPPTVVAPGSPSAAVGL